MRGCLRVLAELLEFGDVGAGNEGFFAGARDDEQPHARILGEFVEDFRLLRHGNGDGVASRLVVEQQFGNAVAVGSDHPSFAHVSLPQVCDRIVAKHPGCGNGGCRAAALVLQSRQQERKPWGSAPVCARSPVSQVSR